MRWALKRRRDHSGSSRGLVGLGQALDEAGGVGLQSDPLAVGSLRLRLKSWSRGPLLKALGEAQVLDRLEKMSLEAIEM